MRVDFYQLGTAPLDQVIASLSVKLLGEHERLLVIAGEEALLARLDRSLWDMGPASFLPHGVSGTSEDSRQPVLLSTTPDSVNGARNLLMADGTWREAALSFDRAFYLFDGDSLEAARDTWRSLAGREGVERHFWANEGGRWTEKAADSRQ